MSVCKVKFNVSPDKMSMSLTITNVRPIKTHGDIADLLEVGLKAVMESLDADAEAREKGAKH